VPLENKAHKVPQVQTVLPEPRVKKETKEIKETKETLD
jgi:hypothetical protein